MASHHHINLEDKFRRFLYLSNPACLFVTGNPDGHYNDHKKEIILEMVKTHPKQFINVLIKSAEDKLLTKRQNLFYALALSLTDVGVPMSIKLEIKDAVLKICKKDQEFFHFVKYHLELSANKNKISKSLKKIIVKYYEGKTPLALAESIRKANGYQGWKHKDLIKLCHIKTVCPLKKIVVGYILFGYKEIKEKEEQNEAKDILVHLSKTHEFRTADDALKAAALLDEFDEVPPLNQKIAKKEELWNSVIPKLSTIEILQKLTKFYKLGLLKPGTSTHVKIIEALTNVDKIKNCDLHPVDVFIYLKNFEKGGKAIDPQLLDKLKQKELQPDALKKITTPTEPKCQVVINNINKCLMLAYNNVQPTEKRFMITIDVTNKNHGYCMHNKNISTFEAAYALTRCLSKMEKTVTVAVFVDDRIEIVDLNKTYTIPKFVQKLQETKSNYIMPHLPFDWSIIKKKPFDVFINIMSCDYLCRIPKDKPKPDAPSESLRKYSAKMKIEAKFIRIFLGGLTKSAQENTQNVLNISGFSTEVPRVLEAFVRGNFI